MRQVYFENLSVDVEFKKNGNTWIKRSLKTAEITKPESLCGNKRFYFGMREVVEVAK
tara:strand:- start:545 stop:715 length:171 start_codon:yes stop_codon:yes gene_type:complete